MDLTNNENETPPPIPMESVIPEDALPSIIAIEAIQRSPLNPSSRRDVDAEFTESVRMFGVLKPILVRRLPDDPLGYELIAGERRWTAASRVGRTTIAAYIIECTEREAAELRLVENIQTRSLLPMDEASMFGDLRRLDAHVDEIAARIGRSPSYVYQRLRLLELHPRIAELVHQGLLEARTQLYVAQLPAEVQASLAGVITPAWQLGDSIPHRSIVDATQGALVRQMHSAPWPLDVVDVTETAGPCSACPKRTGGQLDLFEASDRKDYCLDAACWAAKVTGWWGQESERARKVGLRVLTDDECARFVAGPQAAAMDAPYFALDQRPPGLSQSWRDLRVPAMALGRYLRTGHTVELVEVKRALAFVTTADPTGDAPSPDVRAAAEREERALKKREEAAAKAVDEQREMREERVASRGRVDALIEVARMIVRAPRSTKIDEEGQEIADQTMEFVVRHVATRVLPGALQRAASSDLDVAIIDRSFSSPAEEVEVVINEMPIGRDGGEFRVSANELLALLVVTLRLATRGEPSTWCAHTNLLVTNLARFFELRGFPLVDDDGADLFPEFVKLRPKGKLPKKRESVEKEEPAPTQAAKTPKSKKGGSK